jgi:site-specific DNA recombinase
VREVLDATLADQERSVRLVHEHLTKTLSDLDAKEENLLDLVEAGGTVAAKVRARLVAIGEERGRLKSELEAQGALLEAGAALIRAALDLLDDPQELYRQTADPVRRQLNQVFFDKLYLDADEVTDDILSEPFDAFLHARSWSRWVVHTRGRMLGTTNGARVGAVRGMMRVPCSNASHLARVRVRQPWWSQGDSNP